MKESKEVKQLRGKILGMEMELSLISKDLERFEMELAYNLKMQKATNDNIKFLREEAPIISLNSLRKIMQQKKLVDMRVVYYKSKITPLKQRLGKKENSHKEEMERFEKIYRDQFKNNVLEFPDVRRKEA